jgi:hypothetical protein
MTNPMKAYVQTIYSRRRHVGYGVYAEERGRDGLAKNGRCLAIYRFDGKGKTFKHHACDDAQIALYLANTHRDDFNSGVV